MFIQLVIWASRITVTSNFVLQDSYNVLLKDSAHYKIDIIINEEEYEMISADEANKYNIGPDNAYKLQDLNRLASEENNRTVKFKEVGSEAFNCCEPQSAISYSYIIGVDKDAVSWQEVHAVKKRNIGDDKEPSYNYDDLFNEYYAEANEDAKSNLTYKANFSSNAELGIIRAVKMFLILTTNMDQCANKEAKEDGFQNDCALDQAFANITRFWKMIKIWLILYLIVALPLWCTQGWCCCCLFCKFCKPKQTIEEAKRYLALNPPGVLTTKKGEQVHYDASESEKEAYEEFEHFLRTL